MILLVEDIDCVVVGCVLWLVEVVLGKSFVVVVEVVGWD